MKEPKLVKLMVYSTKKKTKDGKKSFVTYATRYNARKEDGTRVPVYYDVKFTDDAFKNANGLTLKDVKRGILEVDASCIGCPDKVITRTSEKTGKQYYVIIDEDGNDARPVCWIRDNAVKSFVPVIKEHEFNFDMNEQETEETEIVG